MSHDDVTETVQARTFQLVRPDGHVLYRWTGATGTCMGLVIDRDGNLSGMADQWGPEHNSIPAPWRIEVIGAGLAAPIVVGTNETGINGVLVGRVQVWA